jgi:hypothetical protein
LASYPHDGLHGFSVGAVDDRGGAQALRHFETIVVKVDHDYFGRRIELGGEKGGQTDRPGTDDRDLASGHDFAVDHPAFESGWQDVT